MPKLSIQLPKPMQASNDCLPHAAMNLGSSNGVGTRPRAGMVDRLVLEEQFGNWVLYRLDAAGGFVGDTWHGSREDAIHQIFKEFGVCLAIDVPPLTFSRDPKGSAISTVTSRSPSGRG